MTGHDCFERGATGHDAFGSAAEAGEEMRLDEAGDDPDVRVGEMFVDERGSAVVHHAELLHRGGIFGFVIDARDNCERLRA